ncbi:MAG: DciA family protein [Acidocella sp.]|uniref:DciA family protein n=1 Tax=Acidocella sp. TaxID=50710 RepID=UPI003FD7A376
MPAERKKRIAQTPVVPVAEPPRNFSPRGIAALIAPITRPIFRRRAPAAAQLLADWPQLAGPELAGRALPVKFAGGTLTLGCAGPTAMELQMLESQIIARLNLALGHATVERLRFVQQSPRLPTPPPPPRQPPRNLPPPPDLPDGPLGEALARLYRGLKSRG